MSHVFNHTFTISGDDRTDHSDACWGPKFCIAPVFRVSQQVVYLALSVVWQDALVKGEINEVIEPPPPTPPLPSPCCLLLCSCVARIPGKGFLLTQRCTIPLVSSFGSSRMGWEPTLAFAQHWSQVDSHLSQITHPLTDSSQGCAAHRNLNY